MLSFPGSLRIFLAVEPVDMRKSFNGIRTNIDRKLVKSIEPSPISPMPPALLGMLEKEEIFDLVAYVLSGGNPEDERFR